MKNEDLQLLPETEPALPTLAIAPPKRGRKVKEKAMQVLVKQDEPAPQLPSVQSETGALMAMITRMSTDPTISIERVEQTFAFYQRVQADQARKEWAAAFVAAQAEMEPVKKDASNPQTKSRFATHAALDKAIRPHYSSKGFAVSFDTESSAKEDFVRVVMMLFHSGGHERRYEVDMPADGKGAKGGDVMTKTHAVGSAMTYGRRYLLGNAFNIAVLDREDDDGNAASASTAPKYITTEQVEELKTLLAETKSDSLKFLAFCKLDRLEDIFAAKFEGVKALIRNKKGAVKNENS